MQKICILTNNDHDNYEIIFDDFNPSNKKNKI